MAVILEVTAGPLAGKQVTVVGGQTVTVGRTPRSNFAVPGDTFMSGVHFSVECGANGCLLTDQKSSNGTFLNKTRVTQALLKTGDEVRSGQTVFVVRVLDESAASRGGPAQAPDPRPATSPAVSVAPLPLPSPRPTERTASLDQPGSQPPSFYSAPIAPPATLPPLTTPPRAPEPFKLQTPPAPPLPLAPKAPAAPAPPQAPATIPPPMKTQPPTPPPAPKPVPRPPATPPRAPAASAVSIGGWTFATIPERWVVQEDYGIQRDVPDGFPSSVVVTEELLGDGLSLQQYVEAQLSMLRQYLREPQIDATLPPKIGGADETIAVDVRYKTKDGQGVFYRRIYSRVNRSVGIFTFTTLENELAQLRPVLDAIVSSAGFSPSVPRGF